MDPQSIRYACPNPDCPARGQIGDGNIGLHSQKERRYRCRVCGKTFAARKGTAFYRLRTAEERVTIVITLLAAWRGCPLPAIVAALGLDERTVALPELRAWHARAGDQGRRVQAHLVEQPRDLGQVPADELWVKLQGLKVWMATPALAAQVQVWRCRLRPACPQGAFGSGWAGWSRRTAIGP